MDADLSEDEAMEPFVLLEGHLLEDDDCGWEKHHHSTACLAPYAATFTQPISQVSCRCQSLPSGVRNLLRSSSPHRSTPTGGAAFVAEEKNSMTHEREEKKDDLGPVALILPLGPPIHFNGPLIFNLSSYLFGSKYYNGPEIHFVGPKIE